MCPTTKHLLLTKLFGNCLGELLLKKFNCKWLSVTALDEKNMWLLRRKQRILQRQNHIYQCPCRLEKNLFFFFETFVTQERSSQALQLLSTEKDYRKERMNKKFKFEINHKVVQISLPQHSKSSVAIALICSWRKIVSFVFVKII